MSDRNTPRPIRPIAGNPSRCDACEVARTVPESVTLADVWVVGVAAGMTNAGKAMRALCARHAALLHISAPGVGIATVLPDET